MDIRKMNINDLLPANYNPRKDLKKGDPEYDRLKKAIQEFDYIDPIIWNERSGHIVGGHQRAKILKELGKTEVEVSVVNLDEDKEKALNIALNKTGGDWDYAKLKDLLVEIDTGAFDIEITGFGEDEIERLLTQFDEPNEIVEDDFDADAEAQNIEDPITQRGDIWNIGRHLLMCGDSTLIDDMEKLMGGNKADMVFTDPPYGYEYESNHQTTHKVLKNDDKILDFLPAMVNAVKENAAIYICGGWQTLKEWLMYVGTHSQLKMKNIIIWKKNNWSMGDLTGAYAGQYEIILFLHHGRVELLGDRKRDVWEFDREPPKLHPTMKPIELIVEAMDNSAKRNAAVLDLFGGSGSTMMACEQTGRTNYSMELDPRYCDVIVKRWETFTGQKAVRISGEDQGREADQVNAGASA